MTDKEAFEQQVQDCEQRWFKEHKATILLQDVVNATVIDWSKPDSWTYGCRFIIHKQWLCVMGDIGEAIYQWGQNVTLGWLAGLDFHYFFSKLRASDDKSYWNPEIAWTNLQQFFCESDISSNPKIGRRLAEINKASVRDDYTEAARDIYDITGEAELASMISTWGQIPHPRHVGYWVGLKMASAQLLLSNEHRTRPEPA